MLGYAVATIRESNAYTQPTYKSEPFRTFFKNRLLRTIIR